MTTGTMKTAGLISAEEILKRPYSWNLIQQANGTWFAEIREIPGCAAQGNTEAEALMLLRRIAQDLISVYLESGRPIPQPVETEFSGRFALRMPKDLHRRAAFHAHDNETSLNQFIVDCVSYAVGVLDTIGRYAVTHTTVCNFYIQGDMSFGQFKPFTPGLSSKLNAITGSQLAIKKSER